MNKIEIELDNLIPEPRCELYFSNTFELLIAVILSAQCTDKRVNSVTKELFKKYKTPKDFANLKQEDLAKEIYSLGFYNSKSQNIISCAKGIVERFNGEVPDNLEDLISLDGVGRKTASVVLAEAYNKPAFAVDTHVFRVANRLGIGDSSSVEKCENALKKYFNKNKWRKLHLQMVHFGRYYCTARAPKCNSCNLKQICLYYKKKGK